MLWVNNPQLELSLTSTVKKKISQHFQFFSCPWKCLIKYKKLSGKYSFSSIWFSYNFLYKWSRIENLLYLDNEMCHRTNWSLIVLFFPCFHLFLFIYFEFSFFLCDVVAVLITFALVLYQSFNPKNMLMTTKPDFFCPLYCYKPNVLFENHTHFCCCLL